MKQYCDAKTYINKHLVFWFDTFFWTLLPAIEFNINTLCYTIRFRFLCFGITIRFYRNNFLSKRFNLPRK